MACLVLFGKPGQVGSLVCVIADEQIESAVAVPVGGTYLGATSALRVFWCVLAVTDLAGPDEFNRRR